MTTAVSSVSVFLLAENRLLREALSRILNKKNDVKLWGLPPTPQPVLRQLLRCLPMYCCLILWIFFPDWRLYGTSVIPSRI